MTASTKRRVAMLEKQIGHNRPLSDEEVLRAMERGRDRARAKRLAEQAAAKQGDDPPSIVADGLEK